MMARQYLFVRKWKISWQLVKNCCKDTASNDMSFNINDQSGNRWNVITCTHALTKCKHTCLSPNMHILSLYSVSLHWQNKTCLKFSFDPESTVRNISQFGCFKRQVTKMSKLFNTTFISSKGLHLFFQPLYILENLIQDAPFCQQHFASHSFSSTSSHLGHLWPVFRGWPQACRIFVTGTEGSLLVGHQEIRLYKQTHVVRKRTDILLLL